MECRLKPDTDIQKLFKSLNVQKTDVIEIEADALWSNGKFAPWARDLVFTGGSTDCIQILKAKSISQALKRLTPRGLIEFFSGFVATGHDDLQMYTPTVRVRNDVGGPLVKRIQ